MTNSKMNLASRVLLGVLTLVILAFTIPAYVDTANNPALAYLSGANAGLGGVAGAFLGRQITLALIAAYGVIKPNKQTLMIGGFAIAAFNLHDAFMLFAFGSGGAGAIAGVVLGVLGLAVMYLASKE